MALASVLCTLETYGAGSDGHVFLADLRSDSAAGFMGTARMAIVDRPQAAQSLFQWKAGADDWLASRSSLRIPIHHNRTDGLEEYLSRIKADLETANGLLCGTGVVYVFADQRASAHVRLLLDEEFGRSNFLNEIIWAHEAGLRPAGRFTRSHETIFLYRKGQGALFNTGAAGRARGRLKSHMRRTEEGGRAFYSREAQGRIYRYYEDDIVSIGDVWTDIPEIAARDDERLGWEGQRPEELLSRLIAASSAPGDTVCDVCSGSGAVASVAQRLGRRALLSGSSPAERMLARRRLLLAGAEAFEFACDAARPDELPEADATLAGNMAELRIYRRLLSRPGQPESLLDDGLGSLEYWAAGRHIGGVFRMNACSMRTRQQPTLARTLPVGEGEGQPCIQLVDANGDQWFFLL